MKSIISKESTPKGIWISFVCSKYSEATICLSCDQGCLFLKRYKVKDNGQIKGFFALSLHTDHTGSYESINGVQVLITCTLKADFKRSVCSDGFLNKKNNVSKKRLVQQFIIMTMGTHPNLQQILKQSLLAKNVIDIKQGMLS